MNRTAERSARLELAGVLLLVTVVSLPVFLNGFVIDDWDLIVDGTLIHQPRRVGELFFHHAMYAADPRQAAQAPELATFRPLTLMTFFLDARLSGRAPWAYHLTNLLAHLAVVVLVWLLGRRWLAPERRLVAPWAAAWFGLHPTLAEAHIWINGRSDPLAALLGLAAVLLWSSELARAGPRPRRALVQLATGLLFLGGLLCKEVLLFVLPALLLWEAGVFHGAVDRRAFWRATARLSPLFLAAAVYLVWRVRALSGLQGGGEDRLRSALLHLPYLLGDGLRQLLLPTRTTMRLLSEEYAALPSFVFFAAWAALLLLLGLGWRARRRAPLLGFGLVWYACTLAPASLVDWPGFGRYLYLPFSVLALALADRALAAARALPLRPRLRRFLGAGALAYGALLLVLFSVTVREYRSWESFHRAIVEESPETSHGWGGLGVAFGRQGRYHEARRVLRQAVARDPDNANYWLNLGLAYLLTDAPRAAERVALNGVAQRVLPAEFNNLAALTLMNRELDRTVVHLLEALLERPDFAPARRNIVLLTTRHPRRVAYRQAFRRALAEPRYAGLRRGLTLF
ncbi:MAG: tetratricopeptide repeat protein [Proteobacteria bacterium]|nr:tetratricopeptide repeat protein [Pseudomonadota bacterium]